MAKNYDCGDDIKQRSIPSEDTSWRSKGGYASKGYADGKSGGYPCASDVSGSFQEYSPTDPNCGGTSGSAGDYSPADPNRK